MPITSHNGGAYGELSADTETKEGERIDEAKSGIVKELEQWREKLIAYEAEIKGLKRDIEGA